jgi:hypothetical protein
MMRMVRARYTLELNPKEVQLVRGGQTGSCAAKSLGISEQAAYLAEDLNVRAVGRVTGKAIGAEQMETIRLKATPRQHLCPSFDVVI